MRLIVINLISLFITMASLHVGIDSDLSFYEDSSDRLSSTAFFNVEPLRNPNTQTSYDVEIASQDSTDTLAYSSILDLKIIPFLYYLPIYALHRAKEYFLLI